MKVDARAFICLEYTCPSCQSLQCLHDVKEYVGMVLTIHCSQCHAQFEVFILVMQLQCMMQMRTKEEDHADRP